MPARMGYAGMEPLPYHWNKAFRSANVAAMTTMVLGLRELNRATLARQLLLDRVDLPASEAIEHLVGLQAQAPNAAYVGLWSRLAGFQATELASLASSRAVVRTHLHRC